MERVERYRLYRQLVISPGINVKARSSSVVGTQPKVRQPVRSAGSCGGDHLVVIPVVATKIPVAIAELNVYVPDIYAGSPEVNETLSP